MGCPRDPLFGDSSIPTDAIKRKIIAMIMPTVVQLLAMVIKINRYNLRLIFPQGWYQERY